MSSEDPTARSCGPYRTTAAYGAGDSAIAAGALVYFHNHSEHSDGAPVVHLPVSNEHNRWRFHRGGIAIRDPEFVASLEPLKREGFYRVREHFHPDAERVVAADTLVQLGYNRAAEPILFFPRVHDTDNALVFPSEGMRVPPPVYALLEPLDLRGAVKPPPVH